MIVKSVHHVWKTSLALDSKLPLWATTTSFHAMQQPSSLQLDGRSLDMMCEEGRLDEALEFAELMDRKGIPFTRDNAYKLLQGLDGRKGAECGMRVQSLMLQNGIESISVLGDHLIRLFSHSGNLVEANLAFQNVIKPSHYTWSAIISANAKFEQGGCALELYRSMQVSGDKFVFLPVLKACTMTLSLCEGRIIHDQLIKCGLHLDIGLENTLLDMYAKSGSLPEAQNIFEKMQDRNVVSWSAMIAGYVQHGEAVFALDCFDKMQKDGTQPNHVTFLSILKAITGLGAMGQGKLIHSQIVKSNLQSDLSVANTLIDMYGKCGWLEDAETIFDKLEDKDVVSCSVLIAGYAQNGDGLTALNFYERMMQHGMKPTNVTFLSILKACTAVEAIEQGRLIHFQIIESGLQCNVILGSTLVDMYAKSGYLTEACEVFYQLPTRDVVLWNAMISGYAQNGRGVLALECFTKMGGEGIEPTVASYLCILKACATVGAIEQGRLIHHQIEKLGFLFELTMCNTLVDMYAKCGSLNEAVNIFEKLVYYDVVSWSALIAGYAMQGEGLLALQCLENMLQTDIKPNDASFTCTLVACSRAGLVDEGYWCFISMRDYCQLTPSSSHFNCMVDLLCRAGYLDEAKDFLEAALQSNINGWTSLLSACRMLGNVNLGRHCFNELVSLDFHCAAGYILMSNIYADVHMQEDAYKIEKMRKWAGAWEELDDLVFSQ